ncbi:MAG: aconitate hydratase [Candidatus Thermoplasmatota archaeon]|nr:aconitate hydratase [Candidatus Thermoplasmatota archaeon]
MVDNSEFVDKLTVNNTEYKYYSLDAIQRGGYDISTIPVSLRIILESMIRNFDGKTIRKEDLHKIANWSNDKHPAGEIPFIVSRVIMQDLTGVPAIVDLATIREFMKGINKDPSIIEPQIAVDLVIDHSVQVDVYGNENAIESNREMEFIRNKERYEFLKWASTSFKKLRVMPPSVGIVHQINLEYLATVVIKNGTGNDTVLYPDTLVGTDSHTTMINGLGVLGWGVGGIEAEAAMLGQPITFSIPEVVGVNLHGALSDGVTATDLVLTLTELLRKNNVVGKFVEFYGDGIRSLSLADRATISNMCPEYGATTALFPVDDETIKYLKLTGRNIELVSLVESYFKAQHLFGVQKNVEYNKIIDVDLDRVRPSISGPKLPQQRMDLEDVGERFIDSFRNLEMQNKTVSNIKKETEQIMDNNIINMQKLNNDELSSVIHGMGKEVAPFAQPELMLSINKKAGLEKYGYSGIRYANININGHNETLGDGDIVIAAITSCTNTSNPKVMIAAGLLAKKAYELGLRINTDKVKTSMAPGSQVVSEYLKKSGLLVYLEKMGFYIVGYGCTTCIGNSGPLHESIEKAIVEKGLNVVSVLSGNRNFEARIHKNVKSNYLMSPPLVVAFAIAGNVIKNIVKDPLGISSKGKEIYLHDIWPSDKEINEIMNKNIVPDTFIEKYRNLDSYNPRWKELSVESDIIYNWNDKSTYIRKAPFLDDFIANELPEIKNIVNARPLLILGNSVTTDHISPAGSIPRDSPAARYLVEHGVSEKDFNTYGARRGNHEVMVRGTFANTRIKNQMVDDTGGYTLHIPSNKKGTVYDIAMQYKKEGVPLIVFAGEEYGTGSSRDWAAKGTYMLGVRTIIAKSFERIHRSNLIDMGILPLQFPESIDFAALNADFKRPFTIKIPEMMELNSMAELNYFDKEGKDKKVMLKIRLDTPVEIEYYKNGGILPYMSRKILNTD